MHESALVCEIFMLSLTINPHDFTYWAFPNSCRQQHFLWFYYHRLLIRNLAAKTAWGYRCGSSLQIATSPSFLPILATSQAIGWLCWPAISTLMPEGRIDGFLLTRSFLPTLRWRLPHDQFCLHQWCFILIALSCCLSLSLLLDWCQHPSAW